MRPIISIVGRAESGKTTLLESLIVELRQRGYKVAVIKHAGEDFELDKPNKDSWRFSQAGSEAVVLSSPHKVAVTRQVERDLSPHELSLLIGWDYDLILVEGFKKSSHPKIEVHRREQGSELVSPTQQLLAIVTDEPLDVDVPQFSRDKIQGLADLIEKNLQAQLKGEDVELLVNGAPVSVNLYVRDLLARILVAMVSSLKGVREVKSLSISLRRKG